MHVSDASDASIFSLNDETSVIGIFQYSGYLLTDATIYFYIYIYVGFHV